MFETYNIPDFFTKLQTRKFQNRRAKCAEFGCLLALDIVQVPCAEETSILKIERSPQQKAIVHNTTFHYIKHERGIVKYD